MSGWLATPLAAFALALLAAFALDLWARGQAAKPRAVPVSRDAFVGGGPAPAPARPAFHLFRAAILYTVLHVAALVIVTGAGAPLWLAIVYVLVVGASILALVVP